MEKESFNVLFLCTHNSARSIMAECIITALGRGRFRGFSAGSRPSGRVHPFALQLLARLNYDVSGARSKPWEEFAAPGAPGLDFVFTVCDDAADEVCPVWPGQPMTAHWSIPDPAEAEGTAIAAAFNDTYRLLNQRIGLFTALSIAALDKLTLQRKLREIGRLSRTAAADA